MYRFFWFSHLKLMQDVLSFNEMYMYTLWGLSSLLVKQQDRNGMEVAFAAIFEANGTIVH